MWSHVDFGVFCLKYFSADIIINKNLLMDMFYLTVIWCQHMVRDHSLTERKYAAAIS